MPLPVEATPPAQDSGVPLVYTEDDNLLQLSVTLLAQAAEVCVVDQKVPTLLMTHVGINTVSHVEFRERWVLAVPLTVHLLPAEPELAHSTDIR
ncbi:hypothetical protein UY3_16302 [Chelonia mydas]|uniref:Uncharacterized protein n=1 Tax=Chelonia mydas TaxID=8469 RepID=M7AN09_CHEMY|nr:hypothetical protein UY3_16302 [Chelonia mydas]